MSKILLAIFLGGGVGSVCRFLIQRGLHEQIQPYNFPYSTFFVNILGCMLIGLFYSISSRFNLSQEVRLMLTTGLCGGFTTFSSYCYDGVELINTSEYLYFALYMALSVLLGIAAVFLGVAFGKIAL